MRRTEGAGKFLRHVPAEYPKHYSDNLKQLLGVLGVYQLTVPNTTTHPLAYLCLCKLSIKQKSSRSQPTCKEGRENTSELFSLLQV